MCFNSLEINILYKFNKKSFKFKTLFTCACTVGQIINPRNNYFTHIEQKHSTIKFHAQQIILLLCKSFIIVNCAVNIVI